MEGGKTQESSADEGAEEDGDCDEVGESTIISNLPASRMRETRRYLLKEREENLPNNSKMAAKSTISTSFRLVLYRIDSMASSRTGLLVGEPRVSQVPSRLTSFKVQ